MSQRQKNLSDPAPYQSRPPSSNSAVKAGVSSMSSSNAGMPSRAPTSPESLAGPSGVPQRSMAMFSGIEQVHINGGTFTINNRDDNTNNRDDNILRHLAQSLPRSNDAAFNAAINLDNLSRRPCTDGTRVDTMAQIMAWINENDPAAPPVYWLTGLAGLGKTTIAYTICERLNEARLPFASFFCSLQLDSKNSKLLVTTLCRDLAELYNSYAANVLSILETNSKTVNASLRIQIDELLAKPWQASIAQLTDIPIPIVVVDALDECDRGTEFLEELLRVIRAGQLTGIKFLVTSRPDPKIVDICKSFPPNAICKLHEVDTANVQRDIEKYLREALPELKDEPELALLSQRAGGFFIYATTAVRFISPPHSRFAVSEMRSHLQTMANAELLTPHADSDERLLVDELYERILGDAFRDARVRGTRLRILHTILCAESGINISVLADLTNTDQDVVERVVESLHAVLFIKDGFVYWYHASFLEFVFSEARAKISISLRRNYPTHHIIDVFCDPYAFHGDLARRCFLILQESLHFNMCNLPSSYLFDSEVLGLNAAIDETFSPTLRYVSRHWARHLSQAVPADDLICGLKVFLRNILLFWMEAMNLMGVKSECSSLLKDAESWAEREWPDLLAELTDAKNFSSFFAGSPASKSTPHLYISALSMWNQQSPIWRNWRDGFRFIPSVSLPSGAITIPLMTIHTSGSVRCTAFSPEGNRIVSGSDDKSVRVWDGKTGELLRELKGHTNWVTSVAFSPDGNQIVSGSDDKSVRVWNATTGELLRELQGHTAGVMSVAFSPQGNQIVSGSFDKSVRVWNAKTGEQLKELQGHTAGIKSVTFSPDGNRISSGCYDGSVRVWDTKTGKQLREPQGHTALVWSVAFSPDGHRIVSGSNDKSVRVWDAKSGVQLREQQSHTDWILSVAFSPDGNQIVSGSDDKSVRVWDAESGGQLRELQGHTDGVTSVAFSPDGNRIVSGSHDKSVRVWDAKTGEQLRELQGHTEVLSVAFSPAGNRIISGCNNGSVRVWDVKTGEQLNKLQGHTDRVWSVAFSPDGNRIVSGSEDNSVRVWDAKTGEQLKKLQGHTYTVSSVAFSPDSKEIVSGSFDDSVRVWDAETGKELRKLQGHTDRVWSVAFSPDGKRIVSGSEDKSVRIWPAKTGGQLRELQGHTNGVRSVAFSPDGSRIASGSDDKSVRVWHDLNLDATWVVKEDGWIISGAERLVWVPSTSCNVLLRPHNMLVISRNGSATISFAQCKLGTLWHECYTR